MFSENVAGTKVQHSPITECQRGRKVPLIWVLRTLWSLLHPPNHRHCLLRQTYHRWLLGRGQFRALKGSQALKGLRAARLVARLEARPESLHCSSPATVPHSCSGLMRPHLRGLGTKASNKGIVPCLVGKLHFLEPFPGCLTVCYSNINIPSGTFGKCSNGMDYL